MRRHAIPMQLAAARALRQKAGRLFGGIDDEVRAAVANVPCGRRRGDNTPYVDAH